MQTNIQDLADITKIKYLTVVPPKLSKISLLNEQVGNSKVRILDQQPSLSKDKNTTYHLCSCTACMYIHKYIHSMDP